MGQPQKVVSETERAVRAYADEIGILHHAQHLKESCGMERAIDALELAVCLISKNYPPSHTKQRMH